MIMIILRMSQRKLWNQNITRLTKSENNSNFFQNDILVNTFTKTIPLLFSLFSRKKNLVFNEAFVQILHGQLLAETSDRSTLNVLKKRKIWSKYQLNGTE